MLGKDALPKVEAMSPAEIAAMRGAPGIGQAVLGRLHERGGEYRKPTGTRRASADRRSVEAAERRQA